MAINQKQFLSQLQKVSEDTYQQACRHFKIVSYRQIVFKGFFSPEIYQEILANQEILTNLKITTPQLKK